MWQPEEETLYFLDLGMIGEVGPDLREHMMLLLMAFWQQDVGFLTDVTLMLTGAINRTDLDVEAFQEELGALMARNRGVSLKEIQLGPVLQEMTEIALRHDVALPASLTLTAKALAQMQLAASTLDPGYRPVRRRGQVPDAERGARDGEQARTRRRCSTRPSASRFASRRWSRRSSD